MALAAYNTDLSVNHLHGELGVTEKIRKAMYESAKQFVYIGFLLKEVRDYKYYEEGNYESVYAYAEFELGFKRSSTKNFIAIAETFGMQKYTYQGISTTTQSMSLQPAYENFNYSQLVELLAMSDTQRKQAKPGMTVKQLRSLKRGEPEPKQVTIEELEIEVTGQTSGQAVSLTEDPVKETWYNVEEILPQAWDRKLKLVIQQENKTYKHYQIAYYKHNEDQWCDINGNKIKVLYWMTLPHMP